MGSPQLRAAAIAVLSAIALPTTLALTGMPASAHNALVSSSPANGADLRTAPTTVTLRFAEPPDARFVRVAVAGRAGANSTAGTPTVAGSTVTQRLGSLAGGKYVVIFRVVSRDGHPIQGSVTFTAPATPPPTKVPTPAAATRDVSTPGLGQHGAPQSGAAQPARPTLAASAPAASPDASARSGAQSSTVTPARGSDAALRATSNDATRRTSWLMYGVIALLCLGGISAVVVKPRPLAPGGPERGGE